MASLISLKFLLILLLALLGLTDSSEAQVYYLTSDGSATTAADAFNRMNADGAAMTALLPSFTSSPSFWPWTRLTTGPSSTRD